MKRFPVTGRPTVYNNVRFVPPKPNKWYRMIDGRVTHSDIVVGDLHISIAYFTSAIGDGYTAVIYKHGVSVAHRDLRDGNPIRGHNILSAEKQALAWMREQQTCEDDHESKEEAHRGTKTGPQKTSRHGTPTGGVDQH